MITLELVSALPKELNPAQIRTIEQALTRALRIRASETATLRFVGETVIQKLNKQFRGKNTPTDVLSFSSIAPPEGVRLKERMMGDIVIATSYARKEAKRRSITLTEELVRLIVHGILHLHGFDHHTSDEEAEMFALQERCVEACL